MRSNRALCHLLAGFLASTIFGLNPHGWAGDAEFAPGSAEAYRQTVVPFLQKHCLECHDDRQAKAGLRINLLSRSFISQPSEEWVEVMDAINSGDMPPGDRPRPNAAESFRVVKWIASQLTHAEKTARAAGGQIPIRRLNRDEFANTVRDLLLMDAKILAPIVEDLPGDGKAEGFDRLGAALFFDQTQLERTLSVAERISQIAIVNPDEPPQTSTVRFEAEQERSGGMGIRKPSPTENNDFVTTHKVKVAAGPSYYSFGERGVTFVQGKEVYLKDSTLGRLATVTVDDLITEDGYYKIRVRGGVDRGTRDEPIELTISYNFKTPQEESISLPMTPSLENPDVVEATMFLRHGAPDQRRKITLLYNDLRRYIVTTPTYGELRSATVGTVGKIQRAIQAGDDAEVARLENLLKEARQRAQEWKGPVRHINPKHADVQPPRFFLDWMEIEGPIQADWPPKSHRRIFYDGDENRSVAHARELITRFLPLAYRRPVSDAEVAQILEIVQQEFQASNDFHSAMRMGLQRVLISPSFLYLIEPTATKDTGNATRDGVRPLNHYELASRLSYFLWSTMPDAELFELAENGELGEPSVLATQVDRMLADPKSKEFVENFAGQWLSVRDFGSIMPAQQLYKEYDSALEEASKREAYAFFEEILAKDLSITHFLDSDFLMINQRLAEHYGIQGVTGEEFQRVAITPDHHRGGVLGMAGLMTLLADGTRTLPVRRAAWIVENLFNDPPPPPPPNAGEVQPNTAGEKLTVRERLERHRNEATCASCHATLDPYGMALENYDAIGKWRTRQNGEGFRGKNSPVLDVSGELPGGMKFQSLEEFKSALVRDKDRFARALSQRMLTYALGRPVGYSDRDTVESFVEKLKANDYRIQTLIHAIVACESFQTK